MSLSIASEPLKVAVKPSQLAFYYLLVAHTLGIWGVLQSGIFALLLIVFVSLILYWLNWRKQSNFFFVLEGCQLRLYETMGQRTYELGRRHFIGRHLIILQLKSQQNWLGRYLVLFSDAVNTETFRRLRVLLRFP